MKTAQKNCNRVHNTSLNFCRPAAKKKKKTPGPKKKPKKKVRIKPEEEDDEGVDDDDDPDYHGDQPQRKDDKLVASKECHLCQRIFSNQVNAFGLWYWVYSIRSVSHLFLRISFFVEGINF